MARPSANVTNDDADRPTLPARLNEFRTALEEEIKAARTDKTNFVHLTNGHFVARIGGVFHYEFETSAPVRVPPDTPGELTLGDQTTPVPVTVVEVADLKVTIACREHFGHILPTGKLRADLTMLLRRLIERIEQKAGETWPVAERLLDGGPVSGAASTFGDAGKLSEDQVRAVESALGRDLTFIWGPPGTGKTETIGSIGKALFGRRRTLLLVSHTNVAVDEALLRIAKLCESAFAEGEIIRLGEPVKPELIERKDLISREIAARRTKTLELQQHQLQEERRATMIALRELERLITIVEWAQDGAEDIQELRMAVSSLQAKETDWTQGNAELSRRKEEQPAWDTKKREAAKVKLALEAWAAAVRRERELIGLAEESKRQLDHAEAELTAAGDLFRLAQQADPLRIRRAALGAMSTLASAVEQCRGKAQNYAHELTMQQKLAAEAQTLLEKSVATNRISRLFRSLPNPDEQRQVVAQCVERTDRCQQALAEAGRAYQTATLQIQEAERLDASLSKFKGVPSLSSQAAIHRSLETKAIDLRAKFTARSEELRRVELVIEASEREIAAFKQAHSVEPDDLLRQAEDFLVQRATLADRVASLRLMISRTRREIEVRMLQLLATLREVQLTDAADGSVQSMMAAITAAHVQATTLALSHPSEALVQQRDRLDARVGRIDNEITAIKDKLERVERDLILNARIIATTLTRAFMREVLQERSFDTILCDEASMAPIPALWAAATLATHSAIIVGDFHQLPPIVQSGHPLAKRWLGRDIFEVSKVRSLYEKRKPPSFFVPLFWQRRMHPQISDAPNRLVYKGLLKDHESVSVASADGELLRWYRVHQELNRPLLLIDTSKVAGWNNKAGKSRLNFLSTTLCVRLAVACLRDDRPGWEKKNGSRIFIITPYRPQAALIARLLREEGICDEEIQASTAHSCQGGQADMVIVDLVVDQPHRATTLTTAAANEDTRRLLNVAMTRARRRLIMLGNFEWLRLKGSGAFVGGELLPYLLRKHRPLLGLTAWSLLAGLTTREQMVRAADVEEEISEAAEMAKRKLIIFSPALSFERLVRVAPLLLSAVARKVHTLLITRPLHEEGASKAVERLRLEECLVTLRSGGVAVVHKSKMHEKLILSDKELVWMSTFSPLGESPDDGWLERRKSITVNRSTPLGEDIYDCLGLQHVLDAIHEHQLRCPLCHSELWMADTGPKSDQPFFWKCARAGCRWTRALREPGVLAGVIVFPKCNGRPSLDYHGNDPVWLCDCGLRHRVKVKDTHVMLPRMWALVPNQRRNRLLKILGLTPDDLLQQGDFGL